MVSKQMQCLGETQSCIRELFEYGLVQRKKVGSDNVFDFALGNPFVPTPPEVQAVISDLVLHGDSVKLHGYTSAWGSEELRRAVAEDLNARFHAAVRPKDLLFTCGAAPAVIAVMRALAVPDYEIVAIAPYFVEYRMYAGGCGAKFTVVPPDLPRFQIDLTQLEACLSQHTQAVIINSPNNPSGVVYTQDTLEKLASLLTRKSRAFGHPIYIIADEPYRELTYDGIITPFIPTIYADTVVCYSYSKSLSLPGERIGYIYVPEQAADGEALLHAVLGAARTIGHVCAPSLMQQVIARCASVRPDLTEYDRNRQTLYHALTEYGYHCVKPDGAFYLFVEAPGGDSCAFSERAKRYNLLLIPGNDFGCPSHFRLSTCVPHDMILRSLPVFKRLMEETAG